jgi:hypothetical protein
MEHHLNSTEDALIESLSFKLPNSANFITDKRSVSYYPSNGNEFSPQGVKILRFMLTGTDWLDPSTLRVQYKFNNRDTTNKLFPINSLAAIPFRRLRILCGGQLVEDIDYYNLVYNMLHTLLPVERRMNDVVEGFGFSSKVLEDNNGIRYAAPDFNTLNFSPSIPQSASRIVSFPLLCGLMNQTKKLPLKFLQGLQIELEIVNQYEDCVLKKVVVATDADQKIKDAVGTQENTSTQWTISEAVIHCDVLTLDTQLDNEYTEHLMSGKGLPIAFSSFVHQVQATGGTDRPVISLSRSFTRLETVFCTFYKVPYLWYSPDGTSVLPTQLFATHTPLREQNLYWHPQFIYQYGGPMGTTNVQSSAEPFKSQQGFVYQANIEPEIQLQIGSKLFPEIPIRSSSEAYYHLRKALGCEKPNSTYSLNINEFEYRTTKFIVGFDIQREHSAFASGMNTRTGDLITIKCLNFSHKDNTGQTWINSTPDFIHITLCYSGIMNITDAGVQVLD